MRPLITNQLSACERLSFLLTANFALNVMSAHVLTRLVFVPMLLSMLVDSHSGMQWLYHWTDVIGFHDLSAKRSEDPEGATRTSHSASTPVSSSFSSASWFHFRPVLVSSFHHTRHQCHAEYFQPFFTYGQHWSEWWRS